MVEFQRRFADEEACRAYLFASRWPEGYRCRRCGQDQIGGLQRARSVWQCKGCGQQTSVTAGTIMHATRTPLTLWFWAAYLVATHTPGMSALQVQRQLGLSRYETAWLILHKLRRAMVAPERHPLALEVEADEAFIGGRDSQRRGGRQHDGSAALVGVAVELRGRGSGRLRLQVLPNASQATLGSWVASAVASGAIVHTDGWGGYNALGSLGFDHRARRKRDVAPEQMLPLAHRAVANLKTWLQGTHRGVAPEHLQAYLDEFVFRHNRRRSPQAAFQTLLGLSTQHQPTTYRQIVQTERTG